MSDTSRTDAEMIDRGCSPRADEANVVVSVKFARQLERELANERSKTDAYVQALGKVERQLAEAREANQRQVVTIACLQLRIRDALAALNRDVCLA